MNPDLVPNPARRTVEPPLGSTPTATAVLAEAVAAPFSAGARAALATAVAQSRRDRVTCLLDIYALATAPLSTTGDAAVLLATSELARLKQRLEDAWVAELDAGTWSATATATATATPDGTVATLRSLAAHHRLPAVYRWVAHEANREQMIDFLAIEGGPDSGFDDLVALCQVGLDGPAKMEMAQNYWDEMGNGSPAEVHTTLYRQMAAALRMPHLKADELPVEALERSALGGLLATNRHLQPEMIGALGMIELQAGPRCRLVLKGLARVEAPAAAAPFYAVHADVDPRHGQDWLDKVVAPTVADHPTWGPRIVRGARWRSDTNAALFDLLGTRLPVPAAA